VDEASGLIAGSPLSPDLHDFTIQVTDSSQPPRTATAYFTLTVADRLVLYRRSLPKGVLRSQYRLQLQATGGTPPNRWELMGGTLPPGLRLDRRGRLRGSPRAAGEFRFTVRVTDSGRPAQTDTGLFAMGVVAPLTVEWKRLPRVERGGIYGSVVVSNGTNDNFDLTLIVVAVNEYGKAFVLGYQRIVLEKESMSVEIPFGFSLPRGDYVVHVDAVAEVAPKNAIYRDRREQEGLRVE
jgi:hypothetical protein